MQRIPHCMRRSQSANIWKPSCAARADSHSMPVQSAKRRACAARWRDEHLMRADTLLLRNATHVATMDDARREISGGSIFMRGKLIEAVGSDSEVAAWMAADAATRSPEKTIDAG